ncbi:MAG TPA: cell division protein FtsA [Longimicrobiales bacterium]|nr:cell division protein FtsA [Longimicrobiales bacterium]
MRQNLVAGLDIGSTKTCAVIAEVVGDTPRTRALKILGVGQARTGGVRREVVTDLEETTTAVKAALKEAELMAGVKVERVWAGMSGAHIDASTSTGVVAVGGQEIDGGDIGRVHEVARAVVVPGDRELLHALPQEYIVDHQRGIRDPQGMVGTRLETEVYIITAGASAGQNLRRAVGRAGYEIEALVHEPLATSYAVLTEDEREIGVAMVDLGGGSTELAVYRDGRIRHLSSVNLGANAVTSDLVKGLAIPFHEAERTKEQHGVAFAQLVDPREMVGLPGPGPGAEREVPRELIAHIIEQRLDEVLGMVAERLEETGEGEELGAGIVLTGGGASLPGIVEVAQHVFGKPVRVGQPGEGLTGLTDSVRRPKFATAVGLCLYAAEQGGSPAGATALSRMLEWLREFF